MTLQVPSLHNLFSGLYGASADPYQLRNLYKMHDKWVVEKALLGQQHTHAANLDGTHGS